MGIVALTDDEIVRPCHRLGSGLGLGGVVDQRQCAHRELRSPGADRHPVVTDTDPDGAAGNAFTMSATIRADVRVVLIEPVNDPGATRAGGG